MWSLNAFPFQIIFCLFGQGGRPNCVEGPCHGDAAHY